MNFASRPRRIGLRLLAFHGFFLPRSWRWSAIARLLHTDSMSWGHRVVIHTSHLRPGRSDLVVGHGAQIGDEVLLDVTGVLTLGSQVTISERASIYTHDHITADRDRHWREQGIDVSDVMIGDGAWIGAGATILPSAQCIGEGAVVGAASVVTKPVPPYAIAVGNPARVVSYRGGDAE